MMTRNLFGPVLLALMCVAGQALSQPYPVRPIRVIAAQSAGSSLDTITRIVTNKMSELLDQQLVVDNRGGAGAVVENALAAAAGSADRR